ncbi:hypothetical protein M569_00017 [Genlisea aurea]|uniref:Aspartic peptidase DDI1-type domain-containing protein n=1 Tax=Genlisea aurea TaxID=192259 RepID=S8EPA6_9LAMI|nr:hypothetical protein M569_00017 [Genlisea aurea]
MGISQPHDDPLIIRALIANREVHRVLMDQGSATNLITAKVAERMRKKSEWITPVNTCLYGFNQHPTRTLGQVYLPVTLGATVRTETLTFLVVDIDVAFNALLGRPGIRQFDMVHELLRQISHGKGSGNLES